jgi:hypothetical protein
MRHVMNSVQHERGIPLQVLCYHWNDTEFVHFVGPVWYRFQQQWHFHSNDFEYNFLTLSATVKMWYENYYICFIELSDKYYYICVNSSSVKWRGSKTSVLLGLTSDRLPTSLTITESYVRFHVLTADSMKITAFCDKAPCSLVGVDRWNYTALHPRRLSS